MTLLVVLCTLIYINKIIVINIINELLRYILFKQFTYNWKHGYRSKITKIIESKHGFFMMGHIKDDFKNFVISQLFNKSIIILEKIGVIVLAIF